MNLGRFTEEQVETAARALCISRGVDPNSNEHHRAGYDPYEAGHYTVPVRVFEPDTGNPIPNWKQYEAQARDVLVILATLRIYE